MPKEDTQFKKGDIPNPKGRPKKSETYSDTLRDLLQGQDINVEWTVNGKKKQLKVTSTENLYYGVASAQIMEALKGNVQAQREIVDRIQGKAVQTNVVKGEVENLDDKLKAVAGLIVAVAEDNTVEPDNADSSEVSEG